PGCAIDADDRAGAGRAAADRPVLAVVGRAGSTRRARPRRAHPEAGPRSALPPQGADIGAAAAATSSLAYAGKARVVSAAPGEVRSIHPPAWLSVVEWPCPRRDRRRHGCRRRGYMDVLAPCPGLGKAIPRRPAREGAIASRARRAPTSRRCLPGRG